MSNDPSFDFRLANGRFAKGSPDGPDVVLNGELTPQEGAATARVLMAHAYVADLDRRMTALEEHQRLPALPKTNGETVGRRSRDLLAEGQDSSRATGLRCAHA
ncbi:MAG: hypothetical protein J0J01_06545 [Reyranella sp.]|uniref:hypothetical protein n=1 Tax=Reyranella sp. TaxID=1929291 RepID=UPI001AC8CCA4|nr:hypothetical protein [Reyranella sp.]MBN9086549.1 hypothetical protein [Reyranella sp.]